MISDEILRYLVNDDGNPVLYVESMEIVSEVARELLQFREEKRQAAKSYGGLRASLLSIRPTGTETMGAAPITSLEPKP
jgi:hypothetical protein